MDDALIRIQVLLAGAKAAEAEAAALSKQIKGTGAASAEASAVSSAASKKQIGSLGALQRVAKVASLAIGGGLIFEMARGVGAFRESRKITLLTANAIRESGGAANVTAGQVGTLANKLSLATGVDDELVQTVANSLLTFTAVRNELGKHNKIFDRAAQTALDMTAAYPGTTEIGNARALGKALQEPATMAGALKKSGAVTGTQLEHLQKMGEAGVSTLRMQKFLLNSINKQGVMGAAAKNHDAIDRLGVDIENLEEKLGAKLWPTVQTVAKAMGKWARGLKDNKTWAINLAWGLGALAAVIVVAALGWTFGAISSGLMTVAMTVQKGVMLALTAAQWLLNAAMSANPVVLLVLGLIALGVGLYLAYQKIGWFRSAVDSTWDAITRVAGFIRDHWKPILIGLGAAFGPIGLAIALVVTHLGWFGDKVQWIIDKVTVLVDRLNDVKSKLDSITSLPGALGNAVTGDSSGGAIAGVVQQAQDAGLIPPPNRMATTSFTRPSVTPIIPSGGDGLAGLLTRGQIQVPVYLDGKLVGNGVMRAGDDAAARA